MATVNLTIEWRFINSSIAWNVIFNTAWLLYEIMMCTIYFVNTTMIRIKLSLKYYIIHIILWHNRLSFMREIQLMHMSLISLKIDLITRQI